MGDQESDKATLPHLLASFHHLERLVVAAEALCNRLPGCDVLVDRLLRDAAGMSMLRGDCCPEGSLSALVLWM